MLRWVALPPRVARRSGVGAIVAAFEVWRLELVGLHSARSEGESRTRWNTASQERHTAAGESFQTSPDRGSNDIAPPSADRKHQNRTWQGILGHAPLLAARAGCHQSQAICARAGRVAAPAFLALLRMQRPENSQSVAARGNDAHDVSALPPLVIGVLLYSSFATRLADLLAGVASLRDLTDVDPDESLDLLVVDPRLFEKHPPAAAVTRRLARSQVPLVYYTTLSHDAMFAAAHHHELVPARLVMHREDDSPATLRDLVELAPRFLHAGLLRQHVRELLEPLAPSIRVSFDAVVRAPEQFFDAGDVATHAGLSRRQLDRVLAAEDLAPTKHWVVAARAWHAARLLACPESSVESVAERLGYRDSKALRRHLRAVWGITPSALAGADAGVLLAQLVAFLGG